MERPVTVLLVDDSPYVRRAFSRVLARAEDVRVVGEAEDGERAIEAARSLKPDVVLLDVGMPVMDGLSTLAELRKFCPESAVVIVSASTRPGAHATLRALEMGAFDFVDKTTVSTMELHALGSELLQKVRAAARSARSQPAPTPVSQVGAPPSLLVIGASTGGPPAIAQLLETLPADWPTPIAIVQHIARGFLEALAERLDERTQIRVRVASANEPLIPGVAYFAPVGAEANVVFSEGLLRMRLLGAPKDAPHVPSVDGLFRSAAATCQASCWGVLLTGMGRDGAAGMLAIHRAGGFTIAQDQATSAVWGMPRAAAELGAASVLLPLHEISTHLIRTAGSAVRPSSCSTGSP